MPWGGSMQNKHKGFTLIELMVTIAVMAIIAMMAAPSFSQMKERRLVQESLRDLASSLTTARSNAALYRQDVTVHLGQKGDGDESNLYWELKDEDLEVTYYQVECRETSEDDPTKVNSQKIISVESLEFNPQGNINDLNNPLRIEIKNNKSIQYLQVSNFGRVEILPDSGLGGAC